MTVITEGSDLIIRIPLNQIGEDSKSTGKTTIHASSGGAKKTEITMGNGKPLQVSVLAYTSKK